MSAITTLNALMQHNEKRFAAYRHHEFFRVVSAETLRVPARKKVFLACVRRFSENFQRLIFVRQGLCEDPRYYANFLQHLNEEIGHDAMLDQDGIPAPIQDTIFEAILGWFNYQMIVLDNVERAALMHLVLETGGDHLHSLMTARLQQLFDSPYFQEHAELDAGHAAMGADLIGEQTAVTYARLGTVVDRGWDMTEAILDRVAQLVTSGAETQPDA